MSGSDSMHDQLEMVLAREVADFKSLLSCKQLTAGASQETFRVQLETDEGERLLALRRCPPTLAGGSVPGQ